MLTAEIYTNSMYKGCSNGGISSRATRVTIVNANGPVAEPTADAPAVILVARKINGMGAILTVYPAVFVKDTWAKDPRWFMAGGSFIHTSDSRFRELCLRLGVDFYGAVSFHDRHEG